MCVPESQNFSPISEISASMQGLLQSLPSWVCHIPDRPIAAGMRGGGGLQTCPCGPFWLVTQPPPPAAQPSWPLALTSPAAQRTCSCHRRAAPRTVQGPIRFLRTQPQTCDLKQSEPPAASMQAALQAVRTRGCRSGWRQPSGPAACARYARPLPAASCPPWSCVCM